MASLHWHLESVQSYFWVISVNLLEYTGLFIIIHKMSVCSNFPTNYVMHIILYPYGQKRRNLAHVVAVCFTTPRNTLFTLVEKWTMSVMWGVHFLCLLNPQIWHPLSSYWVLQRTRCISLDYSQHYSNSSIGSQLLWRTLIATPQQKLWQEMDYHVDVYWVTLGAHTEIL